MTDTRAPRRPADDAPGGVGARVRALFGPHERAVSEAYRRAFVDLDDFVHVIAGWTDAPPRVLEIGCGEGALAERLTERFPNADYHGIDVSDRLGRMYAGRPGARFEKVTAQTLAARAPHAYDLVVMADVLHHVPAPERDDVLRATADLTAPGGLIVFKDWDRRATPIHLACWSSDRFLTGDPNVRYLSREELRGAAALLAGSGTVAAEATVRPWAHNRAFAIRP